jgi:hypothetical protein
LVGGNLLGIVLNGIPAKGPDSYSYGYYRQDGQSPEKNTETRFRASSIAHEPIESGHPVVAVSTDEMEHELGRRATIFPASASERFTEGSPSKK